MVEVLRMFITDSLVTIALVAYSCVCMRMRK